jgi:ABC-2 type transport system permease protein
MSDLRRAGAQLTADMKIFRRNPAALFFTAILPVIFLCMFVGIFGNERLKEYDNIRSSTLQVPAFIALAVVSAAFVSLAMGFTRMRESGMLKRVRATPVPSWIVFAGRIGTSVVTAVLVTALLMAIGSLLFGVKVPTHTLPGLLAALALGAGSFCALGIAYTRVIPSEEAGPAMTNAVVLPLYFISGVFVPFRQLPDALQHVAELLPVQPFVDALRIAFDPNTSGAGFAGGDLLKLAVWGVIGLVAAVKLFDWTPRQESG